MRRVALKRGKAMKRSGFNRRCTPKQRAKLAAWAKVTLARIAGRDVELAVRTKTETTAQVIPRGRKILNDHLAID